MSKNIGHLEATLGINTLGLTKGLAGAQAAMKAAGVKMQAIGRSMTMALSAPLAIMGGLALHSFASFEKAMNQVKAVTQGTASEMASLEKVARELGKTTKFTATEAAEGMNFLAMAGFEVNEIMTALPATLNLAAAGNMELARSADIVSNIMQGFRLEAGKTEEVSDILTKTFTSSNTSLEQLGFAMSFAAPAMKAFGQGIETTSAAIGFLSDAGIQGSRAGTGLRQIFTQLVKKQKELGISMTDVHGKFFNLADIIEQVEKRGLTTAKVFEIMGPRAGIAMATLMDRGSESLRTFSAEVGNAGGITERVANTQMLGLSGAFTELKSALTELAISFGEILGPAFEAMADWIKRLTLGWSTTSTETKKVILVFAGLALAAGPVIWALGGIATALAAITWPIALVIAAIGLLTVAFFYIQDNWEAIITRLNDWGWWKNMLLDMIAFLVRNNPPAWILKGFKLILPKIKEAWDIVVGYISDTNWWKKMLTEMVGFFVKYSPFNLMIEAISFITGTAIPSISDKYDEMMGLVEDTTKDFDWGDLWKDPFETVADNIETMKDATVEAKKEFGSFSDAMVNGWDKMKASVAGLMPGGGGVGTLPITPATEVDESTNALEKFGRSMEVLKAQQAEDHRDPLAWVEEEMQRKSDAVSNFTTKTRFDFSSLTGMIGNMFQGMTNVITNALNSTENIFQAFGKFFADFIKGMIIKFVAATIAALVLTAALSSLGLANLGGAFKGVSDTVNFGKALGNNIGALSGLRTGGFVTDGGAFQLHKDEVVSLPAGAAVKSQRDSRAMGGTMIADVKIKGEDIYISFKEAERKLGNTRS